MRISMVVPDGVVVVDGEARHVSMADVPLGLHAVQWDGDVGDVEYGKPNRRNVAIDDLAPYQFLLDRWTAAAPLPWVQVPPPTKEEQMTSTLADPVLAALVGEVAARIGITEADFLTAMKDRMK